MQDLLYMKYYKLPRKSKIWVRHENLPQILITFAHIDWYICEKDIEQGEWNPMYGYVMLEDDIAMVFPRHSLVLVCDI